ncbi:D-2-hydroxyacid dehydrogenase [Candidatus Pelagibacter sp. HIMB1321]|uniref:D-2-hydroxyacid dehydrogenase n=1 Tax=Candidatus Pelagibacter sp. HIMB1321 TaxID=1388755 RepID=UPI000A07DCCD|nr:D-2-hydroxyacid dehydrogenase [Candidatus Pelagibacter sp. HIMB1321]SMF72156.1 Phosphoglycerate dehydrogenase [Candidatus Pelagibacter sp. HIMB1321]
MKKIKIHIRNNHWKEGFLPCDEEGEKNNTITKEEFEKGLSRYPEIKDKIEYLIDWDDDNFKSSMKTADILLGWQFPTQNLKEIAPNLKWIHVISAGVNHLSPFNWMKEDLVLTNSSGVHAKKAGEFGLMSILMLQNHMTRLVTHQKNKEFVSLLGKPIEGRTVVAVGTGSLGGSMIKHISKLGAKVIGVNRKGKSVEGCSKVITFDQIDEVLPIVDFLYLAVPETEETKGLINKERLDKLKKTCGIVNIGRQSVLDYEYLKTKLEKDEIAGAILDVFSNEPIPKSSNLWDTPNLIITPHVSSDSEGNYIEMVLKIFFKNLKLFLDKKELINQVDRKLGY